MLDKHGIRVPVHRIAMLLLALADCTAAQPSTESDGRQVVVGTQFIDLEDTTRRDWSGGRPRPVSAVLWYPADQSAQESDWEAGIFRAGRNAKGASISSMRSRYPLILLSHGTGGGAVGLGWLAQSLASHGYIVAAPNHHGNTGAEPTQPLQGTLVWWDRPRDLSVLLDGLVAHPKWGARVDATRIGVGGFSIGGYTALASVGVRLSRSQWQAYCAAPATAESCRLPPEVREKYPESEVARLSTQDQRLVEALTRMGDDYSDPRVRAAFVMAPVVGPAMTRDSLASVAKPVYLLVGAADDQAAPQANAAPIAANIPGAKLEILPKVSHYSFLPVCNDRGRRVAAALCLDPEGVDRETLHREVSRRALQFFEAALEAGPR